MSLRQVRPSATFRDREAIDKRRRMNAATRTGVRRVGSTPAPSFTPLAVLKSRATPCSRANIASTLQAV
jgi:hypothetical protein